MEANYGILSLVPAIIVVVLAFKTKKTLLSLMVGGFVGVVILSGGNILAALPNMMSGYVIPAVGNAWNAKTLILVTIAGGFVYLIKTSGAAKALGQSITKVIKTRKGAQTATFFAAFAFIYTEPNFTLGVIMRPVTEALGVARVKLAYLCDGLASTIASLSPICSYGPYIAGLITTQLLLIQPNGDPWPTYFRYIPYNFYAILSIFTVFIVIRLGLDVGPMYVAEQRAIRTGQLIGPNDTPMVKEDPEDFKIPDDANINVIRNFAIPLGTLFVTLFSVIFWTGNLFENGIHVFQNADLSLAVICGFITGSIAIAITAQMSKVYTVSSALDKWVKGIVNMMEVSMILICAWALGNVLGDLGLKYFIADIINKTGFPPQLVPAIIMLFGAFIGFSTGSSWGTWALLLPIAFPLAVQFGLAPELAVAAVVSGGLFGDHCSPISDTTILASTASACDHVEHVKTQLPYGITVAISSFFGFVVSGYSGSLLPGFLVALAVNIVILVFLHNQVKRKIASDPDYMEESRLVG